MWKQLKWWLYIIHPHVLRMDGMATGMASGGAQTIPGTAWKYRCRLCGHPFMFIAKSGWEQLQEGHPPNAVFQWMGEDRDERTGLLHEWAEGVEG